MSRFKPVGSRNGRAKATESDILLVKQLLQVGMERRDIAEKMEIGLATVHRVAQGRIWTHVQP